MQISRVQNYNTKSPNFQKFSITPHAEELINTPKRKKLVDYASRVFKNSEAVDFAIKDYFVPKITIKETGEKLLGKMKAEKLGLDSGLRVFDRWTSLEFVLPAEHSAENEERLINNSKDNVSKAIYIAKLLEKTAKEHNGRYLI